MIQGKTYTVHIGNNLDVLPTLPDCSVDSIVTDPPYELGFMGKKWDSTGIAYNSDLWRECLRVLKPGGHLLSFGGSRTWHRIAVAIEDAGFEVRDSIAWLYGSGFPKSLDISKAIDKAAGAKREVVGEKYSPDGVAYSARYRTTKSGGILGKVVEANPMTQMQTAPATPEAQQWEGWGTALKPAFEPVIVARKPLIGTVAENVITYGTGGLNIDGSRIGTGEDRASGGESKEGSIWQSGEGKSERPTGGRWPANVILDEHTAELLDEQSGVLKSGGLSGQSLYSELATKTPSSMVQGMAGKLRTYKSESNSGGASRFFYVAKASKRDRNEGLEELEPKTAAEMTGRKEGSAGLVMKHPDGSDKANAFAGTTGAARQNFHPTVKPTDLMRYLIKLVTPPNGIVLDPFTGSGSTGKAAILEGFRFIGIEMTEDYIPIIEGRLNHAEREKEKGLF